MEDLTRDSSALVRGFPGVDDALRAERLANRAAFPAADAELAAMLICAELAGLAPGRELFAREWPLRQETAYLFRLEHEADDPSPDVRVFSGSFAGRSRDRGAVLAAASALRGALPLFWTTVSAAGLTAPVTVAKLAPEGKTLFGESRAEGARIFTVEVKLTVRVCTTRRRGR